MLTWTTIALLAGFFTAAGAVVDRLWLHHEKPALHDKLTEWWLRLDASKIQGISKLMAEWVLGLGKRIFRWRLFSWQTIVLLLITSWIMTTASATLGGVIDRTTESLYTFHLIYDLPFYWIYLTNLPFDIITILVTIWVLRFVLRSTVVKSVAAVLFDIIIAVLLVLICMASIVWIDNRAVEHDFPGSELWLTTHLDILNPEIQKMAREDGFSEKAKVTTFDSSSFLEVFVYLRKNYVLLLIQGSGIVSTDSVKFTTEVIENQRSKRYTYFAYIDLRWRDHLIATTSFIPTFVYMTALLIFLIAAMMVKATMHLLELATQSDPRTHPDKFIPFTLLGSLFGLMAIFAKLMVHLVA